MEDYKELIDRLRTMDPYNIDCMKAVEAIETLLAERDSMINQLKTMKCGFCKHRQFYVFDEPCITCIISDGQYTKWEWGGIQKESEPDA